MSYQLEVEIFSPVATVWGSWTTTDQTERWLAPRANVVFEVGGAYELFWDDDPKRDSTLGCKLLEIEPESRLVFQWQGKSEFLHMFQPPKGAPTTIEVRFAAVGEVTRVTLSQRETRDLPLWEDYDHWMAMAWEVALNGLKSLCEQGDAKPYWQDG